MLRLVVANIKIVVADVGVSKEQRAKRSSSPLASSPTTNARSCLRRPRVGVRNETAKAETQREAAKLARHIQHDPCTSADAGVCTLALESAGISGPQPWTRRSSDGAKNAKLLPRRPAQCTRE